MDWLDHLNLPSPKNMTEALNSQIYVGIRLVQANTLYGKLDLRPAKEEEPLSEVWARKRFTRNNKLMMSWPTNLLRRRNPYPKYRLKDNTLNNNKQ